MSGLQLNRHAHMAFDLDPVPADRRWVRQFQRMVDVAHDPNAEACAAPAPTKRRTRAVFLVAIPLLSCQSTTVPPGHASASSAESQAEPKRESAASSQRAYASVEQTIPRLLGSACANDVTALIRAQLDPKRIVPPAVPRARKESSGERGEHATARGAPRPRKVVQLPGLAVASTSQGSILAGRGRALQVDSGPATIADYRGCVASGHCSPPYTGGACNWDSPDKEGDPVNCLNWEQANSYCQYMGGRLLSQTEWTYMAEGWGSIDDGGEPCWAANGGMGGTCPAEVPQAAPEAADRIAIGKDLWEWAARVSPAEPAPCVTLRPGASAESMRRSVNEFSPHLSVRCAYEGEPLKGSRLAAPAPPRPVRSTPESSAHGDSLPTSVGRWSVEAVDVGCGKRGLASHPLVAALTIERNRVSSHWCRSTEYRLEQTTDGRWYIPLTPDNDGGPSLLIRQNCPDGWEEEQEVVWSLVAGVVRRWVHEGERLVLLDGESIPRVWLQPIATQRPSVAR